MKSNLYLVFKKEIREMFRDKKSLAMMLIIPFMIPLLVLGMSALFETQMHKDISQYNTIGINYEPTQIEKEIIEKYNINYVYDTKEQLEKKYKNNEINLYITKENNNYTINGVDNEITTLSAALAQNYLTTYKQYLQTEYLTNNQINSSDVINIITINQNITQEQNFFVNYMTVYAFLFIMMAITVSSTYPATDTTAGEKERGTLETLLTFPIKSKDIIIGKFLSVTISSIITGLISLILTIISLFIAKDMFSIYEDANIILSTSSIIYAIVTIIAYSFLISGLCIAIASKSKSFKEAQSALTPLTFISLFPSLIAFMVNLDTNIIYALIPFLNYTMIFSDIVNENISILNIALMLLSTITIIIVVLKIIIKQYKSETVLFSN